MHVPGAPRGAQVRARQTMLIGSITLVHLRVRPMRLHAHVAAGGRYLIETPLTAYCTVPQRAGSVHYRIDHHQPYFGYTANRILHSSAACGVGDIQLTATNRALTTTNRILHSAAACGLGDT